MRAGKIGIVALLCFAAATGACAQSYRVFLDTLSVLDDPAISLEIMKVEPPKPVRLPPSDAQQPRFLKQFYSWRMTNDPDIVIMVISGPDGDHLFIDRNRDNDLTNDGPAVLFPYTRDTLAFDIVSSSDPRQRTRLLLARSLRYQRQWSQLPDSSKRRYVDEFGNLNPRFAKFCATLKGDPEFKGNAGSFYFDDRVAVRRGLLSVDSVSRAIGLFDYSNNGLFNDDDDVLIVDAHGDGTLRYSDASEVHKLNDIFSVGGINFRLHDLDRYGEWIELEETAEPVTFHFAADIDSLVAASGKKLVYSPSIWDLKGTSLDGTTVSLSAYRGKYLLINFWGEWCTPCIQEIPSLVRAAGRYPADKIQFLSFVKVSDPQKARKVIAESGIRWPQLYLDKRSEEFFRVSFFPTNILIFPETSECLITSSINDAFFERNVK